ncbi:SDR family NAD(P)-dependent oxidoreductase [Azospirillum canadense]|uniref:SDR family NAD(P)-dependent oxidoreductase n=1 Tax=Azospirillum canadense TaxID=403962 RepID=UPI002225B88E|nr:SDR family NAD(P)-dependent oxidoreductase [Azospirillum canadense]MCW2236054.1 short-subunit dehydrogenase [Azospirillum canadense]
MMAHRFALVTGASSGIGACFARALPADTNLLLTARNAEALNGLKTELETGGRRVEVLAADLTTDEGRNALILKAEALEIDLLVNNAGVGSFGAVIENTPEFERSTVELNVVATTVLTRALLPGMIERAARDDRRAGLLLVSSTTAFQPVPFLATYSASKSFVLAYGEALAAELRRKPVDVLVLCPGATRTNFGRRAGFALNALPGAADPMDVAREGLHALGRRTVHVHGFGTRNVLRPFLWSRHAASGGLSALLAAFDRGQRAGRGFRPPPRA